MAAASAMTEKAASFHTSLRLARPGPVHYTSRMKTASHALLGLLLLLPR